MGLFVVREEVLDEIYFPQPLKDRYWMSHGSDSCYFRHSWAMGSGPSLTNGSWHPRNLRRVTDAARRFREEKARGVHTILAY